MRYREVIGAVIDNLFRRSIQLFVRCVPPKGRGIRIVTYIDRLVPPSDRLLRTRLVGGAKISCNLSDRLQACVFYTGKYEPEVTDLLMRELRPGDVFLDVGANFGYFSLLASWRCGPTGTVHAFEAAPALVQQLRSDISRLGPSHSQVVVHAVAVLDHSGTVSLVDSPEAPGQLGERYVDEIGRGGGGLTVSAASIDDLFPNLRFDVAKIDVEGAESKVISGAVNAISRSSPRLLLIEGLDLNLARFGSSVDALRTQMSGLGYEGTLIRSKYFAPMIAFRLVSG